MAIILLICFYPFEFLAMNFFNQHSMRIYDGYIRRLSRETVKNIVKKCLSFEASVRQGYYITFTC
jgi:hypothetical protein